MKKLLIISMALISCGKEESKDAALPMQTALLVQKADQLPICNEINDKQVIYVSEEKKLKACQASAWINVELEQNTVAAEKADKGEKGEKGDKGEAGKDGVTKMLKVYSAGKEIGFLVDEQMDMYLIKTSKGYYFRLNPHEGTIPNASGFSIRDVAYESKDCTGKLLTANIRPGEIIATTDISDYTKKIVIYSPKEANRVKSSMMGSHMSTGITSAENPQRVVYCETIQGENIGGIGIFAEAKENDPGVTGLETKWQFELPITIGE